MKKLFVISVILFSFLLVGCGSSNIGNDTTSSGADTSNTKNTNTGIPVSGDHVTINNVDYPMYPGSMKENKLGVDFYTNTDSAEKVFAWYDAKMKAEGWTVTLDASNGKTGQRTYQKGNPSDRPSLEFVSLNVYQDGDKASVNIMPQINHYRK